MGKTGGGLFAPYKSLLVRYQPFGNQAGNCQSGALGLAVRFNRQAALGLCDCIIKAQAWAARWQLLGRSLRCEATGSAEQFPESVINDSLISSLGYFCPAYSLPGVFLRHDYAGCNRLVVLVGANLHYVQSERVALVVCAIL